VIAEFFLVARPKAALATANCAMGLLAPSFHLFGHELL